MMNSGGLMIFECKLSVDDYNISLNLYGTVGEYRPFRPFERSFKRNQNGSPAEQWQINRNAHVPL